MATEPKKWGVAPGANADCNDIPDTADADSGLASWSALFPQLTALPLSAGGRAPKREDFNGLLRAFGQWAFYFMQGGVPSWEQNLFLKNKINTFFAPLLFIIIFTHDFFKFSRIVCISNFQNNLSNLYNYNL